ncbi:MAG: CPBP family intramembrane metalloprotease [Defluviitaleaceae bacterium]|nr:CPBP family intramembrane metalloprotease [Defluviitaleaceae bacterium]
MNKILITFAKVIFLTAIYVISGFILRGLGFFTHDETLLPFLGTFIRWCITIFVLVVIFRYKFKKEENFIMTRYTKNSAIIFGVISIILLLASLMSGTNLLRAFLHIIQMLLVVGLFEELFFRGFVTNEMLSLKKYGIKPSVAIIISGVFFGALHLISPMHGLSIVAFILVRGVVPSILGISFAVILYYKKDVIALMFIHAAVNLSMNIITSGFTLFVIVSISIVYTITLHRDERFKTGQAFLEG